MNRAWDDILTAALREMIEKLAAFVPDLLGVLALLLLGYLVSKLLQRLATFVLRKVGFDRAFERSGLTEMLATVAPAPVPSAVVGRLVFWLIMLTFLLSAADALGLEAVSETMNGFIGYVPNVIGAIVVVVVGLLVAAMVRDVVRGAARRMGLDYANGAATLVHALLIIIVASLTISQLRIETALIDEVLLVFLITVGAALALTLGLVTREIAKNLIAGIYARERFTPGTVVTVGAHSGNLREVGTVNSVLEVDQDAEIFIPNSQLLESVVRSARRPAGS